LGSVLAGRWLWTIVLAVILVVTLPFLIIMVILYLPPEARLVATVLIIVGWGVAAGYREWVTSKRKEERPRP